MAPPRPPELVVFSHLRWSWVWQRPQHVVSRFARSRSTWFVEEPVLAPVAGPELRCTRQGAVTVVQLLVPAEGRDTGTHVGFDAVDAELLVDALTDAGASRPSIAWLYTPLALRIATQLDPQHLVFDVMDDLASFRGASPALVMAHREALAAADVVFTGGRSLHAGVVARRPDATHLFASGVEREHFAPAADARPATRPTPVAGYVGVVDERLDLPLLAALADELPGWEVRVVGPVAKIDPGELPTRPNLTFAGPVAYDDLPRALAGFDVALMPFALNDATRSISPTKSLEYLAAGLPVVSTRVPDVVADLHDVVDLVDDAAAMAACCRRALEDRPSRERRRRTDAILERRGWDHIAASMERIVDEVTGEEPVVLGRRTATVMERSA